MGTVGGSLPHLTIPDNNDAISQIHGSPAEEDDEGSDAATIRQGDITPQAQSPIDGFGDSIPSSPTASGSHLTSLSDLAANHPPTSEAEVANAVNSNQHRDVTLWRGTSAESAEGIRSHGTAGGVEGRNENTAAPTEHEALTQVAGGSLPANQRAAKKPTEYTTSPGTAKSFGGANQIVAVQVNTRYLTKGSGDGENGWTIHNEAPVKYLGAAEGERAGEGSHSGSLPDAG